MFLVRQLSGHIKNFNIGIFSDTINIIDVRLCMVVLHIELHYCISLLVTLTLLQGYSSVKHFRLKILRFYPISLKLYRIVKYMKQLLTIRYFCLACIPKGDINLLSDLTETLSFAFPQTLFKQVFFLNFALL